MLDLHPLVEFSCTYCVGICAFLVPANLVATSQTMLMVGLGRPKSEVALMTTVAYLYALLMVLHVSIWWMLGVVMAPTFILSGLAITCLVINYWAIAYSRSMRGFFEWLIAKVQASPVMNFNH